MKKIVAGAELTWTHPEPERRSYELRSGSELMARLSWTTEAGSLAEGTTDDGVWTFKRAGFLKPRVTVRSIDQGRDVAIFEANPAGGGLLQLLDGHFYNWRTNFWRAEFAWIAANGKAVVESTRSFSVDGKTEGRARIAATELDSNQLSLLVLLGWYLVMMSAE